MFPLVLLIPLAGEWNEKPVMCASEEETFSTLNQKGEKILFMGNGFTKVRTETGLAHKPVTLPFRIYGNLETGTFTIIELHPETFRDLHFENGVCRTEYIFGTREEVCAGCT